MFKKPKKGSTYEMIQGLKCYLPIRPDKRTVPGYGLRGYAQKWVRPELPTFKADTIDIFSGATYAPEEQLTWEEARREEYIGQTGFDPWARDRRGRMKEVAGVLPDPHYKNEQLEAFRKQEFDRIRHGYWFYNKNKMVYVTGFHYFYLTYWKLNTGYPEFRDTDRQLFFFWQYVLEDDRAAGLIEITKRGVGKSYRMGAVAYLMTVLHRNSHVGIQSKSDTDAAEFFDQKVVEPYKSLPEFLVPIHDHGSEPASKLSFFPPADRSASAHMKKKVGPRPIRSLMTYRNAGERAYDGTTLKFLVQDEIAKMEKKVGDAQKRLGVNRNCVYRDSKMVGKIWASSTVEDMDKGGEQAQKIWYQSDINTRSENGRTKSWLYPYFQSALECSHFDEWGYPLIEKAKKEHDAERAAKEGDSVEYVGYVQRNPYNIEEAFMTKGADCIYNARILQNRQKFLQEFKMTSRGDFMWEDGVYDSKVIWVPNDINGRWEVSWLFPKESMANQVREEKDMFGQRLFSPTNDVWFGIAFDPFSHAQTVDNRRSNAAIAVYRNKNPFIDPELSDTFCADYVHRPDDPEDAYEDLIMACVYYGTSALIENNKNDAINYFKRRGYYNFIMERPEATLTANSGKPTDGIPSVTPVIEYYIKRMRHHIVKHGHKLNHLRIVRDLLDFDPKKRTKFDLGVASQLAILAAEKHEYDADEAGNEYDIQEIFSM